VSAKCFGCSVGVGKVAGPMFTLGDPVGCCRTCHVLMCGKHGERDPGPPKFECVICAPPHLAASAARISGTDAGTDDERAALDELARFGARGAGPERDGRAAPEYRSIEEFVSRHPHYGPNLLQALRATRWSATRAESYDSPARRAVSRMSREALQLLGGARVLVERLRIPDDQVSPVLRDALGALVRDDPSRGQFP
jgi:hypothetical protein